MKVASIGECMIEFSAAGGGLFARGFGGDTLNTAVYLSRLGIDAAYVTALGDDAMSEAMLAAWQAEGIDTREVLRIPGRVPGLYLIERDAHGERSFLYWRDHAPAREFFDRADDAALERLAGFDWLYLSGISLSLYGETGRARLRELLVTLRRRGGRLAFDGNYRPRVDLALPTFEDEQALFGDVDGAACIARIRAHGIGEIVVKRGALGCLIEAAGQRSEIPPPHVVQPVDTTAAGDSFNAAYLAARISGAAPEQAAQAGHRLASVVIMSPGAVIAREAMPKDVLSIGASR